LRNGPIPVAFVCSNKIGRPEQRFWLTFWADVSAFLFAYFVLLYLSEFNLRAYAVSSARRKFMPEHAAKGSQRRASD
jgi:hypothetical protein